MRAAATGSESNLARKRREGISRAAMTWGMPLPLAFSNQRCVSHASSAKPKGVISNGDQGAHSSKHLNDANAASASHANANAVSPTRSAPIQNARRCIDL